MPVPVLAHAPLPGILAWAVRFKGVGAMPPALDRSVLPLPYPGTLPSTPQAIALPTDFSAKLARNTQLILAEETGITHVGGLDGQAGGSQGAPWSVPLGLPCPAVSSTCQAHSHCRRWQTPWAVLSTWRP